MTATMTAPTIKRAMKTMGLGDRAGEFLSILDEIALDTMLAESIAAFNRGEGRPASEFIAEMRERFASGYYTQENARKRIARGLCE